MTCRSEFLTFSQYREVADAYATPTYVYRPDVLHEDIEAFRAATGQFSGEVDLVYSLKTNYLPALLADIARAGLGVDVVSEYEFQLAQRLGFAGTAIVVNGPYKPIGLLGDAAVAGSFINIETLEEVADLGRVATSLDQPLPVGVRLGSDIDPYTGTSRSPLSKFGAPPRSQYASDLVAAIASQPRLRLVGIHCHLGSQIVATTHHLAALAPILELAGQLRATFPLDRINVGGGIGVPGISRISAGSIDPSRPTHASAAFEFVRPDVAKWFAELSQLWHAHRLDGLRLLVEPGRAVVSRAMQLLTRVTSVKSFNGDTIVTVDGGLNLMPTAGPGEAHRFIFPTAATTTAAATDAAVTQAPAASRPVRIVGPLCYEGDIFTYAVPAPLELAAGDLVVVADAGAYTLTRATSFNQLRAPVVRYQRPDPTMTLVWRRETVDDILACAQGHLAT